ncbi:MAG TPA: beta-L-arabinofuranosidase domain-containing protein, partial [Phycisphaerae bacterium]
MKRVPIPAMCLAGAALFAVVQTRAWADAGPSVPEARVVKDKVQGKAFAFDLSQVQLLDGPFKHAQDLDRRDLMACNADNFLYPFRREAKLPNPGTGSDALDYTRTGHVVGHYLSAAAFLIRNTGDAELKKKADDMVASVAECQKAMGDGFVGGFPEQQMLVLERVVPANGPRAGVPWYCLHKIYAGLLDMYVLTGNKQALDVVSKAADWAIKNTDALTDVQFQAMLQTEHGGMNEVLANLYAATGQEKYLKLSERFNHHAMIDAFAEGGDSLERKHANTQFPKFIGVSRQYELTGDAVFGKIAHSFWSDVVYERSYVTGGNSLGEQFTPKALLSTAVGRNTTETCNEYNMLKLTRSLFTQDPKAEYADYFERTLYNQILSARNPETGGELYFQQLQTGSRKGPWLEMNKALQCCFGSGMESNAKYADG